MFHYINEFFISFWMVSCMMAPWLLFGFFAAGVLSIFFSPEYIYKHMGKPGLKSIIKAALFGVPLPLCSCGVIPVTVSLKKQGAGRGAAGSFLISTPQTGLDSFFATYSMLGWVFALIRPFTAFVTGIVGGFIMEHFGGKQSEEQVKQEEHEKMHESQNKAERPRGFKAVITIFHYGFIKLLGDISLALLVGLGLAALITLLVPPDFGAKYLKSDWLAMPAMLLFGIPLYVCSTASIPIALSLIVKGISPGAALVFLVSGPATNIATIAIMTKVLGKKSTVIYIISVAVGAVVAGVLLNMFDFHLPAVDMIRAGEKMEASLIQEASAVIMFALIAYSVLKTLIEKLGLKRKKICSDLVIEVKDMTCSHCLESVKKALAGIKSINEFDVNLKSGLVKICTEHPEKIYPEIEDAIKAAGHDCELVEINTPEAHAPTCPTA